MLFRSVTIGFLSFIPGATTFIILIHFLRLIQGMGEGLIYLVHYSLLATAFPNNVSFFTNMINAMEYTGTFLGPSIGSFLYQHLGFIGPFIIFGCASAIPIGFFI